MKLIRIIILILILASCGTSQKIKYANELYNKRSYAEAIHVAESIKGDNPEKSLVLGRSYFKLLAMEKAAASLSQASTMLTGEDLKMYAEALKQIGNISQSKQVALALAVDDPDAKYYQQPVEVKQDADIKVNSEEFNSSEDEMTPFFFQGSMYHLSNKHFLYSSKSKFKWNDKPFLEIVDSSASSKNKFSSINSKVHDGPVFVDEGAGIVLFNRSISSSSKKAPRVSLFEVPLSEIDKGGEKELSFCATGSSYMHPYMNSNASELFFASNFPDEKVSVDLDIYVSKRNDDGTYGNPEKLGETINSDKDEVFPVLLTDSILVFSSNRSSGWGGLDLYSATKRADGTWSEAVLLDQPINSSRDDFYLIEDPNLLGSYYISSNREGNDNIYNVTIPNEKSGKWKVQLVDAKTALPLKNMEVKLQYDVTSAGSDIKKSDDNGTVEANPLGASVNVVAIGYKPAQATYYGGKHSYFKSSVQTLELTPMSVIELQGKITDSETGLPIPDVKLKVTGEGLSDSLISDASGNFRKTVSIEKLKNAGLVDIEVSKTGYLSKTTKGVSIGTDVSPLDISMLADLKMKKINVGDDLGALLAIQPIYFESGKWDITPQGATELDKIVKILLNNPQFVIECGSHTDCRSSKASNLTLSSKRANSTVKYMVDKGVSSGQLKYKGYGEDQPVNDCRCEGSVKTKCSEQELALNRRTEFKVLDNDKDVPNSPTSPVAENTVETPTAGSITPATISAQPEGSTSVGTPQAPITPMSPVVKLLPALRNDLFKLGTNSDYSNPDNVLHDELPAGKLFMIQVGAFREAIDTEIFNGMEPVYSERTASGFTRYCVGMFTNYENAESALSSLQKRGFSDAFIVGYKEGIRVPVQKLFEN